MESLKRGMNLTLFWLLVRYCLLMWLSRLAALCSLHLVVPRSSFIAHRNP